VSDARGSVTTAYTINGAGRLARVSVGGIQKAVYAYDGLERLTQRFVQNSTPNFVTHYIHDADDNLIGEYNSAGTDATIQPLREYIWLPNPGGVPIPVAVLDLTRGSANDNGEPVMYHVMADHLSRPVWMREAWDRGAVVWQAGYEPFGSALSITGPAANDARFPGQWFQLESGLSYNWHRHYDASLGRYTQPDPLGLTAMPSDGPSVFGYARLSPTLFVDRLGKQSTPPPPASIPGGPWKWFPDPSNSRGGTWRGLGGSSATWDQPGGHWDCDDGLGNRQRYNKHGAPVTPEEAHSRPRDGFPRRPIPRWPNVGPPVLLPSPIICGLRPDLCGLPTDRT
jgi:RHS repeat-associated protein